jgi:hypothetical protein
MDNTTKKQLHERFRDYLENKIALMRIEKVFLQQIKGKPYNISWLRFKMKKKRHRKALLNMYILAINTKDFSGIHRVLSMHSKNGFNGHSWKHYWNTNGMVKSVIKRGE